jgi:chromosome segregation ATPase
VSRVYDLPFDQYQRYKLVSTLVDELRGKGESFGILDVGGRTALLRPFLKQDRITLVDLEPSAEPGLVLGDGAALPFRDKSFDLVCAFDTLEHVPPRQRARFVRECARVARRWVVLAGPYQSEEVEEAEQLLQRFLKDKLGVRHRYLEEHRNHGLPDREATEAQLAKLGARVVSLGHGNVQRWLSLISLSMYMDHTPALQAQAVRLQRFYNRGLFAADVEPPVYRHAVVAALDGAPLPRPRPAPEPARAPAKELVHFAQELAAFDARRDGFEAECERLQSVIGGLQADLEGHKRSMAEALARRDEAQRVVRDLAGDLEGHKRSLEEESARRAESEAVIRTLRADLEGHRRSLVETRAQHAEAEAVIRTLQEDLDGHRGSLGELRAQRAESEQAIAALRADLAGHQDTLQQLSQSVARYEGLLGEHREVIAEREAELGRHGRVLDELRANLAALDAEQAKVLDLRAHERGEFEAVRTELEREIAAQQQLRSELERELSSRAEHARQLEQLMAREQQGFAEEQARLRQDREAATRAWEQERTEFLAIVAAREAEIARHADVLRDLRAELEQHRGVLGERERELEEHRRALADLRADLEGHRRLAAAQSAELEERARELEARGARCAELEGQRAHALDQLADLRAALERARAEIHDAAGELAQKERLIGELRADLRSRLRSLRRALGPARPTPGE